MEYVKLGNSELRVSRICLGCMGFGDPTIGQHAWTIVGATKLHHIEGAVKSLELHLTVEDIAYLEEPYVPHNLSGVMAVNKPTMSEEPVWVTARRNK